LPASVDRIRVIFRGDVQGVGFRYTAKRAAASYPQITGMVRNLEDGTVELQAEGPRQDIDDLVTDIQKLMATYIRDIYITPLAGYREYRSFVIGF
jgi:acylphosphatase